MKDFPFIQLSYDVDEKKMREVFRLAGRVMNVQLNKDKEGKSRGHGIIEFTHPVEAVQVSFNQSFGKSLISKYRSFWVILNAYFLESTSSDHHIY